MPEIILLKPGTLLDALDTQIRTALDSGALQPIETEQEVVVDTGVPFLVRMVSSLRRKEADKRRRSARVDERAKRANPFLPPEPELTVAEISRTHLAVLNKFNVLDRHLLIVARRFVHQETLLDHDDFNALFACMAQLDALGFYNGGVVAGSSQPHKHLQLVPLPFATAGPAVPMEPLLAGAGPRCEGISFAHSFRRLSRSIRDGVEEAATQAQSLYLDMLADLGIGTAIRDGEPRQSHPYNLLIAHDWMLAVPRAAEFFQGVSINALGFAGSLFVKDRKQLDLIRREGPMRILRTVSGNP